MHPFPHHYRVSALLDAGPDVVLQSPGVPPLRTTLPAEFGGAGEEWSPETLLVAAVASCYAMTFRGIAAKSRLTWTSLACDVAGTLNRVDGVSRFVRFDLRVRVSVPEGTSEDLTRRVVTQAESGCLVTRSLTAETHLDMDIEFPAATLV